MLHIKLDYTFTESHDKKRQLENPLFVLLEAIHSTGSISKTAAETGFSYRHVWGALKRWETKLGAELIVWKKGERARLTPFGEKLLFAEQRAKARVLPQVDSLVSEMEREFALAFDENAHVLSVSASHDLALNRLKDVLSSQGLHLNLRFQGSLTSLAAMTRGECTLAGLHVMLGGNAGSKELQPFKKLLKPETHSLIRFLVRTQGLMLKPNNPKRIQGLNDLKRADIRFVNREKGSGTRIAVEHLLSKAGITPALVNGFEVEETTHLAVAAAVACGQFDVGFGIEAAAAHFNLGFIPLAQEQYYFACQTEALQEPAVKKLVKTLRSKPWRAILNDMPGYDATSAGQVIPVSKFGQ
ncbi:MAG: LysR family transcriptional regulator [Oxalobacter sp.]|nr:MAG: LysR family transcriptional regulator [Oxalobacter sp.]